MKFKTIVFFVVFMFVNCFFIMLTSPANSEQCHIVKIAKETRSGTTRIYLFPSELTVPRNSCVIWANWVKGESVSINFKEISKTCTIGSGFASGFAKKKACLLTDFLSYGQTVSILFNEKGIFKYQLELPDKTEEEDGMTCRKLVREGKIIVE